MLDLILSSPLVSCSERPVAIEMEPPVATLATPATRDIVPVFKLELPVTNSIAPVLDFSASPVINVTELEPLLTPVPLPISTDPVLSMPYAESKLTAPDAAVDDPDAPVNEPPATEPLPATTLVLPPIAPFPAAITTAPA